jgi:hypothetical protein
MTVPIRDSHGKVIDALAGITVLSKPRFLDLFTENKYGKSGGYSFTSPKHQLIITSSDKRRIMEVLPDRERLCLNTCERTVCDAPHRHW